MAVPIILGAAAVGSALYGIYKGVNSAVNHSDAKGIDESARSLADNANRSIDEQRQTTNLVLTDYGARKLRAFNGTLSDFLNVFGRLKNVDVIQTPELDKLNLGDFSCETLAELRRDYQALKDAGLGLGAGLGGGAALAFGAYNGTMLLAVASTGTAISSLSGVAATNATLAWLGGGSLAAGGFGMAGGLMILGGIVAGPALAIFGHILGNKAETALNNARSNLEQARTLSDEAELMIGKLKAIEQVSMLANSVFSGISTQLRHAVRNMNEAIEQHGDDYQNFAPESRQHVVRAVKYAQLLKAMIDTPILDQNGNLVLSTHKRLLAIGDTAH